MLHNGPDPPPALIVLAFAAALAAIGGCGEPLPVRPAGGPLFVEAVEVGLEFEHWNGMSGHYDFPEIFGAGAALFDFDGDGDLDVYLVQGGSPRGPGAPIFPPPGPLPLRDRLFRNDLVPGGRLRFVDVTEAAGIDGVEYGMGVAVGDYDADGLPDLYVTNLGPNRLWRNLGGGRFEDETVAAGVAEERWSTAAVFFDYDGDGLLDLFVGNYVHDPPGGREPCVTATGAPEYCGPQSYRPEPDRLFRNLGGQFRDVTTPAGLARAGGPALGVVAADFDGDRRPDLYVTNDGEANQLWINGGDGTFRDAALLAGCAFNADGEAEASMGVDAADYDQDGDLDLFMTHLDDETNTLYRNDGHGRFHDATAESGLGTPSRRFTGFGTAWLDADGDGDLDLVAANGAVKTLERRVAAGSRFPLEQQNQIFLNDGEGRFSEAGPAAGPAFALEEVSRAAVAGDVDNDGDADLLITNNNGKARLLLNTADPRRWLGLTLVEADGRTPALGATAGIAGDRARRAVRPGAGYLGSNDPRLSLAPARAPLTVEVAWADGVTERFDVERGERYVELRRGSGSTP